MTSRTGCGPAITHAVKQRADFQLTHFLQLLQEPALKDDVKPAPDPIQGLMHASQSLEPTPSQPYNHASHSVVAPAQQQQHHAVQNSLQSSWSMHSAGALRGHAGSSAMPDMAGHPSQMAAAEAEERANLLWGAPSSKQRLRWTPELHERFIKAVESLGGPDREFMFLVYLAF
jgi:hypothetical protein